MRIHTDTLTEQDVYDAARLAGIRVHHVSQHGSRSRHHALEIVFEGSSNYGGQYGVQDYAAATWDEWGMALATMFERDSRTRVAGVYEDSEHFRWTTGARFDDLTPAEQHKRHRWDPQGWNVTGDYVVRECRCGAVSRLLVRTSWDEFAARV